MNANKMAINAMSGYDEADTLRDHSRGRVMVFRQEINSPLAVARVDSCVISPRHLFSRINHWN